MIKGGACQILHIKLNANISTISSLFYSYGYTMSHHTEPPNYFFLPLPYPVCNTHVVLYVFSNCSNSVCNLPNNINRRRVCFHDYNQPSKHTYTSKQQRVLRPHRSSREANNSTERPPSSSSFYLHHRFTLLEVKRPCL